MLNLIRFESKFKHEIFLVFIKICVCFITFIIKNNKSSHLLFHKKIHTFIFHHIYYFTFIFLFMCVISHLFTQDRQWLRCISCTKFYNLNKKFYILKFYFFNFKLQFHILFNWTLVWIPKWDLFLKFLLAGCG
jgi:hypothetical protein